MYSYQLTRARLASQVGIYTGVTKYQLYYIGSYNSIDIAIYIATPCSQQPLTQDTFALLASTRCSPCKHTPCTYVYRNNNLCFDNLPVFQFLIFYYCRCYILLVLLVTCTIPDSWTVQTLQKTLNTSQGVQLPAFWSCYIYCYGNPTRMAQLPYCLGLVPLSVVSSAVGHACSAASTYLLCSTSSLCELK